MTPTSTRDELGEQLDKELYEIRRELKEMEMRVRGIGFTPKHLREERMNRFKARAGDLVTRAKEIEEELHQLGF